MQINRSLIDLCGQIVLIGALLSTSLTSQTVPRQRGLAPASSGSHPLPTGPYYALIIGNDHYKHLPPLSTPIADAEEIANVLHDRYSFAITLLLDAGRDQIMTALVNYRRTLPDNSNLLIYYAGHGHHDQDADEAYWLPVDALADNNSEWISSDDITRDVKAILSKHILIVSDSCYSGYLVAPRNARGGITPIDRQMLLARVLSSKSRNLMSSGGDEPVTDTGAPGHSIFAAALLRSLSQIDDRAFTASDLFYNYVQPKVAGGSTQLPQYNLIRNSGHIEGDFVFSSGTGPGALSAMTAAPPRPRTMSGHAVLKDCWLDAAECGFKFSTAQVVPLPPDNFVADIVLMNQTDQTKEEVQTPAMLFAPNDTPPYNGGRDTGAKSGIVAVNATDLADVTSAPQTEYAFHWYPVKEGGIYVVRTRDGSHFAKIKVTSLNNKSIGFDWVYQPLDQRDF
jgi:hypothetical protein